MVFGWRKWFHSSRVKLPLVNMSANWIFVSTYLIWFLRIQVDPTKLLVQRNSVGSGYVSRRRTSAFNNHLDHSVIVFKNVKQCENVLRL